MCYRFLVILEKNTRGDFPSKHSVLNLGKKQTESANGLHWKLALKQKCNWGITFIIINVLTTVN